MNELSDCTICSKWVDEPHLRIAELDQCRVMLNADQYFSGYTFVFAKNHVTELFHLDKKSRLAMIEEVNMVAEALHDIYKPSKMNYELLGNMVPHIHWHIVPRFNSDPLWPRPIWSENHSPHLPTAIEYDKIIGMIKNRLKA